MNALNHLAGDQIGEVETATLNRVAIPTYERPQPFLDPCGWIPRLGDPPILARPQDGTVALLSIDKTSPPIEQLVPATNIARSEALESPWAGPAQLDPFGFCSSALRSPLKNTLFIGESMMPGLGIEGACLTAYQAAEAVTASKASRWPFGGKL